MQLAVFEMVKRGLSIDAALAKARMLETSFDQGESVTRELAGTGVAGCATADGTGKLRPEVRW